MPTQDTLQQLRGQILRLALRSPITNPSFIVLKPARRASIRRGSSPTPPSTPRCAASSTGSSVSSAAVPVCDQHPLSPGRSPLTASSDHRVTLQRRLPRVRVPHPQPPENSERALMVRVSDISSPSWIGSFASSNKNQARVCSSDEQVCCRLDTEGCPNFAQKDTRLTALQLLKIPFSSTTRKSQDSRLWAARQYS